MTYIKSNRNLYSRDLLELFLISAVSSLLLLRFYLYLTGYPQVGGSSLHIAHMLWGGLLMLVSITISLSFLGQKSLRLSALIGGAGFGIFIDELGKYITRDNNYFYRPTIGLIYAIFVILYLTFNFLSRRQHFTSEEYQLNVLNRLDDAVFHRMDKSQKMNMIKLLDASNQTSDVTIGLRHLLKSLDAEPDSQSAWQRRRQQLDRAYGRFWQNQSSSHLVTVIFIVQATIYLGAVVYSLAVNYSSVHALWYGTDSYTSKLIIGQLAATLVSTGFVAVGIVKLPSSRLQAFEYFRRALLVNIFLTEFFIFARIQFGALPGFILNILLLLAIRFAIYQESRTSTDAPQKLTKV